MTTEPTQEAWDYFMQHHDNIRKVCVNYLPSTQPISRFDDAVKKKKVVQLAGLMNMAWFKAPDEREVYSIPGFKQMCNLLDGTVDGFLGLDYEGEEDLEDLAPAVTTEVISLPEIPQGHALFITTDGSEQLLERIPGYEIRATLLSCKTFDHVSIGKLLPSGDPKSDLVMILDDNGYESELVNRRGEPTTLEETMSLPSPAALELRTKKALKPVNKRATEYYHAICVPGTTHEIVGDVLIFHDGDS